MKAFIVRGMIVSLLFLIGVVAPALASETTGENLLNNGSLEELNDEGRPVSYNFGVYQGDAEVTVDTTVARTGQNSVRIDGDGRSRGLVGTGLQVEGGKSYRASVWYRTTDTIELGTVSLRIMAYTEPETSDGNKAPWQMSWFLDPFEADIQLQGPNAHVRNWQAAVDEWRLLTVSFKLPENVVALRLEGFNWLGNGSVWFDDFSVVELE